jgi:hypothetical protein
MRSKSFCSMVPETAQRDALKICRAQMLGLQALDALKILAPEIVVH